MMSILYYFKLALCLFSWFRLRTAVFVGVGSRVVLLIAAVGASSMYLNIFKFYFILLCVNLLSMCMYIFGRCCDCTLHWGRVSFEYLPSICI